MELTQEQIARIYMFGLNLIIYLTLFILEWRRAGRVRWEWWWVVYFGNNIIWSLFAIIGTLGGVYTSDYGRWWFPLTQLQFLLTFAIDRYFLSPRIKAFVKVAEVISDG